MSEQKNPIENKTNSLEFHKSDNSQLNESDPWEINTMIVRSKEKPELDEFLDWFRNQYFKNGIIISHIAKRSHSANKEHNFFYAVITYHNPLDIGEQEGPVNVDKQ